MRGVGERAERPRRSVGQVVDVDAHHVLSVAPALLDLVALLATARPRHLSSSEWIKLVRYFSNARQRQSSS
jgi:hypothetical protein